MENDNAIGQQATIGAAKVESKDETMIDVEEQVEQYRTTPNGSNHSHACHGQCKHNAHPLDMQQAASTLH